MPVQDLVYFHYKPVAVTHLPKKCQAAVRVRSRRLGLFKPLSDKVIPAIGKALEPKGPRIRSRADLRLERAPQSQRFDQSRSSTSRSRGLFLPRYRASSRRCPRSHEGHTGSACHRRSNACGLDSGHLRGHSQRKLCKRLSPRWNRRHRGHSRATTHWRSNRPGRRRHRSLRRERGGACCSPRAETRRRSACGDRLA